MKNMILLAASAALSVSFSVCARDMSPLFKPAAGERPYGVAPRSRVLEDGGTGPYKAVMTEVSGFAEHTVFRPADMSPFNPDKPLPVLVWGNGACANSPIEHAKFLNEIASHGYLVLATGIFPETDEPYRGPMSRPEQQIESIDWAFAAQDGAAGDEYCGRIDVKKICIAGMSCGGLQALHNCADPRVTAVMICNSGLFSDPSKAMPNMPMPRKEKLKELHSPVIYILGGEPDIAYGNGMDDFHRINHVPAIAANLPVGHGGTYGQPHGGEFAVVARTWLDWQLKGDAEASKMFVGENCGLAKRPGWTIERNALAENVVEIKAEQLPGERGGLMLKIRTNGGEWRDAAGRGRVFAHSNLGNWGEKNLLDPVLYHDDDGTWHVYYKDRPEGGKDCHAVSWGKDNLTDWGRQNWVDNDLDRARMKKAREGSGIWRLTKTQVEKLGKSEWHPGCPWHFTLDSAKDDEQRYGEAVRAAKPGLRLNFSEKPAYPISRNLIGIFFEDINSSHEVYSTNHVGTYKGHGFRKDIGEALEALKPRFVRFPGGCIVHARDFKSMYHWKETVGPLSERKGKPNFNWGGFQDFALGYYEYFQLCEDIGADALPILPAGVTCPNPQIAMTDAELDQLVADTLDLVEFANGDPKKSKWAKLRSDMGHSKPFGLKYIGLGNEEDVNDYFERGFTRIYKAVRAKYPKIKIVGTAGPWCGGRDYEEGWRLAKRLKVDIVDEHYYVGPGWYYGNQLFYDDYDRKGPKVYVGEYAAHKEGRVNDMETALALAVHLTNLERNGDIVEMSSYAPLFAKKGEIRWSPDLIYFTDREVELTTDYWVQWLFGNYVGEKYVPHELEIVLPDGSAGRKARTAEGSPRMGALGPDDSQRFYNRFSSSVVRRGKTTVVKLVNSTAFAMPFAADLSCLGVGKETKARIFELKGAYDDSKAKPESSESRIGPNFERELPPYSLTVIEF